MPSLHFKQLLDNLQSVFSREASPKLAMQVSFSLPNAKALLTLDDFTLTIAIQEQDLSSSDLDSIYRSRDLAITIDIAGKVSRFLAVNDLTFDLRDWTIGALVENLNTLQGFTATLLDPRLKNLLAGVLLDGISSADLATPLSLSITASSLWDFLSPIAFALEDKEAEEDKALSQLNLLTSTLFFADFWGNFLGVPRKSGEADATYTQRIVDRIVLQRANNVALETIGKTDLSLEEAVTELAPLVLEITNSDVNSVLPGEVFNDGNFLVSGPAGGPVFHALMNEHKAGGTRAFFAETLDTELTNAPTITEDRV